MSNSEIMNDIIEEVAKVGTMLVVSRILLMGVDNTNKLNDPKWVMSSLFTLLGFTAYHVFTKRIVDTSWQENTVVRAVFDDWLKVGTMLIVVQLLSQGSITNLNWVRSSMYTLIGFTLYQVLTGPLIPNIGGSAMTKNIMADWLKFGTMLISSQFLANKQFDSIWAQGSLFTLLGFTVYDVISAQM
jgi:hypothetical protein